MILRWPANYFAAAGVRGSKGYTTPHSMARIRLEICSIRLTYAGQAGGRPLVSEQVLRVASSRRRQGQGFSSVSSQPKFTELSRSRRGIESEAKRDRRMMRRRKVIAIVCSFPFAAPGKARSQTRAAA